MHCNLQLISYWHEMLDLIFLYMTTNGLIDIDIDILLAAFNLIIIFNFCSLLWLPCSYLLSFSLYTIWTKVNKIKIK